MPASARKERYAHRARWRPAPNTVEVPPHNGATAVQNSRQGHRRCESPPVSRRDSNALIPNLDLPQLFAPAEAAEILRRLGLTEMTECALRTRAYRRQVPFHLNGRRIRFTVSDLREIVEGQARRPKSTDAEPLPSVRGQAHRRSVARTADHPSQTWRARQPRATSAAEGRQPR